ncbi:MAG: BirA family biotin operon repressor/biotin-[acetyl-CoA-carboxylase] ligase [Candidatus Promineifilaceae bacterium]|jgi:BirA family biotin operon repressor/biotin-[acetyl-CoA-carboxylase] ligase
MTPTYIESSGGFQAGRLFIFDELSSTNAWLLDQGNTSKHGDTAWCQRQTEGRGRRGRHWHAPGELGLTFSVRIDQESLTEHLPLGIYGLAGALAVNETLKHVGIASHAKWPNDVWVRERKICGILSERRGLSNGVVLGVGLNVNTAPKDWGKHAYLTAPTSMSMERGGQPFIIRDVLNAVLASLNTTLSLSAKSVISAWREQDQLSNKLVKIYQTNTPLSGRYLGVDDDGCARIRLADGSEQCIVVGDISLRQE